MERVIWTASGVLAALLALALPGTASATRVDAQVSRISDHTYEFEFRVENDTLGADIRWLNFLFDRTRFENLSDPVAPAGWDPLVLQPDLLFGDDGRFDLLASPSGGIAPGQTLGSFVVRADFLPTGESPDDQDFEVLDPDTFDLLERGVSVFASPEPAGLGIALACGCALLAASRPRRLGKRFPSATSCS